MDKGIWLLIRILALAAFIGFLIVGVLFSITPETFTGYSISRESALWHGLSLAFMATVTILALMILYRPRKYWFCLLPLGVGKAASALSSGYWSTRYNVEFLTTNTLVDGSIAVISLVLFIYLILRKE